MPAAPVQSAKPSPNAPIKLLVPEVGDGKTAIAVQLVGVPTEVSCDTLKNGGFVTRERLQQLTDIGNPKGAGQAYSEKTRRQAASAATVVAGCLGIPAPAPKTAQAALVDVNQRKNDLVPRQATFARFTSSRSALSLAWRFRQMM